MITYSANQLFGFNHLFRVHGSPIYKVLIPCCVSTVFYILLAYYRPSMTDLGHREILHPYVVGALIAFFSFLLTFRLNFSYGRYWEGATAVHHMQSKWLDAAVTLAAFHYQAATFDDIKPPAFGSYLHVNSEDIKTREPCVQLTQEEAKESILIAAELKKEQDAQNRVYHFFGFRDRKARNNKQVTTAEEKVQLEYQTPKSINSKDITEDSEKRSSEKIPIPVRFQEQFLGGCRTHNNKNNSTNPRSVRNLTKQPRAQKNLVRGNRKARMPAPDLFLQELAHLVSLLSAVALSTLRNDVEGTESPLTPYIPGKPWPPADPDALSRDIRREYNEGNWLWTSIYYVLDITRSEQRRTLYNAARPFTVLGGVSDGEVEKLQRARGPAAKTALCFQWFQEFLTRESMHGSVGSVNGAILSRLYQYTSDGMVGYHQARKVSYIPFPFPHAQTTAFFSLVIIFIFPLLYYGYVVVEHMWFAACLNFFTVLCFLGLHEVARELENPMQNVPNDLPLTTFQAQFNEALVCFYAGYNPNAWWDDDLEKS